MINITGAVVISRLILVDQLCFDSLSTLKYILQHSKCEASTKQACLLYLKEHILLVKQISAMRQSSLDVLHQAFT